MTIDLKALKKKGLKTARFEFSYNVSEDVMTLPDARFVGDAKVVANVEAFEDEAYVDGQVTYRFCAACARCLNPVTLERTADFDELFLSEYSTKKDEDLYRYSRDTIDLDDMVKQLILTDLPYVVYCKEDCKGLCPVCGHDLNDGDCGCQN